MLELDVFDKLEEAERESRRADERENEARRHVTDAINKFKIELTVGHNIPCRVKMLSETRAVVAVLDDEGDTEIHVVTVER